MAETFADLDGQIDALAEMIKERLTDLEWLRNRNTRLENTLTVIATSTTDPEAKRMATEALDWGEP